MSKAKVFCFISLSINLGSQKDCQYVKCGLHNITANILLSEHFAAYGMLFYPNEPSEVMKSKRTIYRKTSLEYD
jgi:hypothetical protein